MCESLSLSLSLSLPPSLSIYLSLPLSVSLSISLSSFLLRSHALAFFLYYYTFHFYLSLFRFILLSLYYRNKETPIEAETDGARFKDGKIQMTVNKEINIIEKSTTNLDLARTDILEEIFLSLSSYLSVTCFMLPRALQPFSITGLQDLEYL